MLGGGEGEGESRGKVWPNGGVRRRDGGRRERGFGAEGEEGIGVAAVERNRVSSHPSLAGFERGGGQRKGGCAEIENMRRSVNGGLDICV